MEQFLDISGMPLTIQICWLFLLALPVACIAWTVTQEEVFREPREYFLKRSTTGKTLLERKFCYLFTCEYCFSHYVTILILLLTGFKLLFMDWRGYLISGFALVWIANIYMSLFRLIRLDIKKDKTEIKVMEEKQSLKNQEE
ncbi:hypothetical protein ACX0G9_22035 [Flavitalea flava]